MELGGTTVLPSGTVTFLITDIEDSSGHWERSPGLMRPALDAHDAPLAEAVAANDGVVIKHMGDGCWAAFASAPRAMAATVEFQQRHARDRHRTHRGTGFVTRAVPGLRTVGGTEPPRR